MTTTTTAATTTPEQYDLIVIGGGPAGYIGAIRAAQLGLRVACVEKEPKLGGTCLRVGCIPSKALLESSALFAKARHDFSKHGIIAEQLRFDLQGMQRRKDEVVEGLAQGIEGLFRKHKITRLLGIGRFASGASSDGLFAVEVISPGGQLAAKLLGKHVLLATGSQEASLPGVAFDNQVFGSSTDALAYQQVPATLAVVGAGAIGLELGSVWSRLGAQVTVYEYQSRILPGFDNELAAQAQRVFQNQGLRFALGVKITGAKVVGGKGVLHIAEQPDVIADKVLVAVGRKPYTHALQLDQVGLQVDERGRIPIREHFATAVPGIYAVGDVVVGAMLAHKAEEEAVACVEGIVRGHGHVDSNLIPSVVYTSPEIAAVGATEEQLQASNTPYRKGKFPYMANSRARAVGDTVGFVKVLAHQQTDRILGVHLIAEHGSELIAEAVAAMTFGASSEDVARTCHAHPTLSEALREAALAVDGRTLNS